MSAAPNGLVFGSHNDATFVTFTSGNPFNQNGLVPHIYSPVMC